MKVMKMMKKATALFLTVGMIVSLAACGSSASSQPAESTDKTADAQAADAQAADAGTTTSAAASTAAETSAAIDKIVFGTNAEFPPFEFISSTGGAIGEFDGIDMAIAKQIGEDL
jgi:polar amino acid transport system substrate-binding protein